MAGLGGLSPHMRLRIMPSRRRITRVFLSASRPTRRRVALPAPPPAGTSAPERVDMTSAGVKHKTRAGRSGGR